MCDKATDQQVMRDLHNQGIEISPDELEEIRESSLQCVRAALFDRGWSEDKLPKTYEEFIALCVVLGVRPAKGD